LAQGAGDALVIRFGPIHRSPWNGFPPIVLAADSATLALQPGTLAGLRDKHGAEIEDWWQGIVGYRFDCLTESEARYLVRVENADAIRARLIEAGSEEHH
jgi:hypothetical protein